METLAKMKMSLVQNIGN